MKDGSDSVGAIGALNRVYVNIGLYSEEWTRHFNAVVGGKPISPIDIATSRQQSAYWRATEAGTPLTARFFLKAARPDYLEDAPGGAALAAAPPALINRGRQVFAVTCARCHSGKQPVPPADARVGDSNGPEYVAAFKKWWRWTQTPTFKMRMTAIADRPSRPWCRCCGSGEPHRR